MTGRARRVCVVIAAWNASATIERAVRSALAEPEVAEVVVVDDLSSDATVAAAQAADDGSGRLQVIAQASNQGPAAARNVAIARSTSPYLATLDADDFFLPGRFAPMFAVDGWDAIADNLVFVNEARLSLFDAAQVRRFEAGSEIIGLADFVLGNVSRAGRPRAELGFAKPLIRRAFLEKHDLAFDASLRLGEDYALYSQLIARGGVFRRIRHCGYVAVERAASLSGRHGAADLAALLAYDQRLLADPGLSRDERAAVLDHVRQLGDKTRHRMFLATRRERGWLAALGGALDQPLRLPHLAGAILRDKLGARTSAPPLAEELRYLFS